MVDMIERQLKPKVKAQFSEDVLRAFNQAEEEAAKFCHTYIGTEHLLLAVAKGESTDPAVAALSRLGIATDDIIQQVEFIIGKGDEASEADRKLTPRAKKVLRLATRAAKAAKASQVTTLHLLHGFIDENDGIAAGILDNLGIKPDQLPKSATT